VSGEGRGALRVVIAEDDDFTRSLVADGLRAEGFDVAEARMPDEAWTLVDEFGAHVLVTDLDFGAGVSAGPLLTRMHEERPWIPLVVLTSHLSPELAVSDAADLPDDLVYIVKSRLRRMQDITEAVRDALVGRGSGRRPEPEAPIAITAAQADMLRMLASGLTTRAIAERRGTTTRAAEAMIVRLYAALGVDSDEETTPRVAAIRLWQQGRVRVR
jgi:Response regulator containing a CheY-like receiver domain and an HTH DNA-binding domain